MGDSFFFGKVLDVFYSSIIDFDSQEEKLPLWLDRWSAGPGQGVRKVHSPTLLVGVVMDSAFLEGLLAKCIRTQQFCI